MSERDLEKRAPRVRDTGHVPRGPMYVVDYDLPADFRRKRFYRAIRRYLIRHGLREVGWSTWSVVFTKHEDFAWVVYREARKVGGTAHVYEARRLDDEP